MKNVDDMNKKDWQKILDKRIIDIAELEETNLNWFWLVI